MQTDSIKILRMALGVAILLLFVWLLGFTARRTENTPQPTEVVRYDTIVVVKHDTIRSTRTILQETYKYDTIMLRDTVFIADIPQNYVDSTPDYRIDIRAVKLYGYDLDIYRADTLTRYVPQIPTEGKKHSRKGRFGQSVVVGLQAGYGLGVQPATMQARFEPYVGIGITYGWGYNW
nr:MAG TPA: hypothetical protein [Caudoviricetes sp.]